MYCKVYISVLQGMAAGVCVLQDQHLPLLRDRPRISVHPPRHHYRQEEGNQRVRGREAGRGGRGGGEARLVCGEGRLEGEAGRQEYRKQEWVVGRYIGKD